MLKGRSSTVIDEAFSAHFSSSKFFPRPADIVELMTDLAEKAFAEREALPISRGPVKGYLEGVKQETVSFGSLIAKFKEIVGRDPVRRFPDPPKELRQLSDAELADRKEILEQQKRELWAKRQLQKARQEDGQTSAEVPQE